MLGIVISLWSSWKPFWTNPPAEIDVIIESSTYWGRLGCPSDTKVYSTYTHLHHLPRLWVAKTFWQTQCNHLVQLIIDGGVFKYAETQSIDNTTLPQI